MTNDQQSVIFQRVEMLLGQEVVAELSQKKVILFGIGGVGSWCAESLVRTGVKHLTLVDFDQINSSNINRQLPATTETIGQFKTKVLEQRLQAINPEATITISEQRYDESTSASFELEKYDYIVDAIDSLSSKAHLIQTATKTDAVFFSSMGAALKLDPSRIKVAEFWKVQGCPLAAALRRHLRKGEKPAKKFMCVYSEELLENKHSIPGLKANGTVSHVTAIFGFTLAGLVIQDICKH